jgi:hypothetical protein
MWVTTGPSTNMLEETDNPKHLCASSPRRLIAHPSRFNHRLNLVTREAVMISGRHANTATNASQAPASTSFQPASACWATSLGR